MVRVLVTDGESRAALAAVRALGRAGHTVYVSAPRLPSLASVSRFAAGSAVVPPTPLLAEQPGQVVGRLRELANAWDADVVLPVTDAAMSAVLRCGGSGMGRAVVAGPTLEAYEAVGQGGPARARGEAGVRGSPVGCGGVAVRAVRRRHASWLSV